MWSLLLHRTRLWGLLLLMPLLLSFPVSPAPRLPGPSRAGRPCISYYDATNRDLKFACRDGGGHHACLPAVEKGR